MLPVYLFSLFALLLKEKQMAHSDDPYDVYPKEDADAAWYQDEEFSDWDIYYEDKDDIYKSYWDEDFEWLT
jgi:hypothetical protein